VPDTQDKTPMDLDSRIDQLLGSGGRMFLATSVGGNSSGASVFYARDGDDLVFFTFNPTRKAEQIRVNPRVQVVIWPDGQHGIRGLQIDGLCSRIQVEQEIELAREKILSITSAFEDYMNDEFLSRNNVTGYYRVRPVTVKYVDFHAEPQFEWKEYPQNDPGVLRQAGSTVAKRLLLWMRALRAPFFTATLVPVLLGGMLAWRHLLDAGLEFNWTLFWLCLGGALCAHAGTNLANDFGDHLSRNDEINQTPSPFNGGSRVIQAGLIEPWKMLAAALFFFALCIACGLYINLLVGGSMLASTPLLWIGLAGVLLGSAYTLGPLRLGYEGMGEIAIALGFGPIMVLGTHYVLTVSTTNNWHWLEPAVVSLPVAILVLLIVWMNQFQDAPADYKSGKHNWVVRLAHNSSGFDYHSPFQWYVGLNVAAFVFVGSIALLPFVAPIGTAWAFIALLPALLLPGSIARGWDWINRADGKGIDWRRHPYELLPVNVTAIGIHLLTGLLLVTAYGLDTVVG
jgi:1,4-dihydroxy-2-naphthoate octaprenyltransferase